MKTEKIAAPAPAPLYPYLDTLDKDDVRQAAYDNLCILLQKIGMSTASEYLRLNVPTLKRIVDDDLPLQAITYLTAAYIVFMCETNARILRVLDSAPRPTAYYKRGE